MSDENVSYGIQLPLDQLESELFAEDQVKRQYCLDEKIKKLFCGDDPNCIEWKPNDGFRMWEKPSFYSDIKCNDDKECDNNNPWYPQCKKNGNGDKVCAYDPDPNDIIPGTCQIISKNKCLSMSEFPYDCSDSGCTDKLNTSAPYYEWHITNMNPCGDSNTCPGPGQSCIEGKCTCSTNNDCFGSDKCINGTCQGGGRCVIGNYALKRWCSYPNSRCQKNDDGTYPPECNTDDSIIGGLSNIRPGLVDVPPWFYDDRTGNCYMTKQYCDRFNMNYNKPSCSKDSDCNPDEKCFEGNCTGPGSNCSQKSSVGDYVVDFTIGSTLFYLFQHKFKCKESFEWLNFSTLPTSIEKCVDIKKMFTKELMSDKFINGIPLYLITWKDKSLDDRFELGFIYNDIKKKFPNILKKIKGFWYVSMKTKDIPKENNKDIKRIYVTLARSKEMTKSFVNVVNNTKSFDKQMLEKIFL